MITKVKEMIIEDDIKVRKYKVEYWTGNKSNVKSEVVEEKELLEKDP